MARPSSRQRSDAVANRARLVRKAYAYFAASGIDASLRGLAGSAGLSEATLYRHFPSHADLVRAMYDELVDAVEDEMVRVRAAPSAWEGIEVFVRGASQIAGEHPAAMQVLRRQAENDPGYRPGARWEEFLRQLVAAAIAEGQLRPDCWATDIVQAPFLLAQLATYPQPLRAVVIGRQAQIFLDGLRAAAVTTPLPDRAPDVEEFHRASHGIDERPS